MKELNQDLTTLFRKYYNKTASSAERQQLMELIDQSVTDENLALVIKEAWENLHEGEDFFTKGESASMFANITQIQKKQATVVPIQPRSRKLWWRIGAACAIVLACAGFYFMFLRKVAGPNRELGQQAIHDVKAPASNRATITLSNGRNIYLDSVGNGTLASQANVKLIKSDDGKIIYNKQVSTSQVTPAEAQTEFNILTNPRGSKVIDVVLSDGSHVWLNAGSSLTYPVAFSGNERRVSITGEGYFEVTHDAAKPFIVRNESKNIDVRVLGTHFNINTYDDEENARVTLLQGSVRVHSGTGNREGEILQPGQQAVFTSQKSELRNLNSIDLEEVMAWKNNLFVFNGDKIQTIMRQVSRWYDVNIQYTGNITNEDFVCYNVSRTENVSQLLKVMETTKKIKFQIEGNTIIVTSP